MTVLHYAAKAGHNNVIKCLLDSGDIDVNVQVIINDKIKGSDHISSQLCYAHTT